MRHWLCNKIFIYRPFWSIYAFRCRFLWLYFEFHWFCYFPVGFAPLLFLRIICYYALPVLMFYFLQDMLEWHIKTVYGVSDSIWMMRGELLWQNSKWMYWEHLLYFNTFDGNFNISLPFLLKFRIALSVYKGAGILVYMQ